MCYYYEIIKEIASKTKSDGNVRTYYRGEKKCHCTVSSKLYRRFSSHESWKFKSDDEREQFLFNFEKRIVGQAGSFAGYVGEDYSLEDRNGVEDFSSKQWQLLADIQHRGGTTNFIDFTKDVNIALFTACYNTDHSIWKQYSLRYGDEGEYSDKDGRVILYHHINIGEPEHDRVIFPEIAYSRVQSSVLVRPKTCGVIDVGSDGVVVIPAKKKNEILEYLDVMYNINITTFYGDLHGYIRNEHLFFPKLKKDKGAKEKEKSKGKRAQTYG